MSIYIKGIDGTGCIVYDNSGIIFPLIGSKSNNQSEWLTLTELLRFIPNLEETGIVVHTDSLLVYKQLVGEYRIKSKVIKPIYLAYNELSNQNKSGNNPKNIEYEYCYPEDNLARRKLKCEPE